MDKKVIIENNDGSKIEASIITYLVDSDTKFNYVVYSKGERVGEEDDEVIYISKIVNDGENIIIDKIDDDNEWGRVQTLLKKIANN